VSSKASAVANFRSQFQASEISVIDCPHHGKKDAADKMIIADMLVFALDNPAPTTILLISGDGDFAYTLSKLQARGYTVPLIAPLNSHSELKARATKVYKWCEIHAAVAEKVPLNPYLGLVQASQASLPWTLETWPSAWAGEETVTNASDLEGGQLAYAPWPTFSGHDATSLQVPLELPIAESFLTEVVETVEIGAMNVTESTEVKPDISHVGIIQAVKKGKKKRKIRTAEGILLKKATKAEKKGAALAVLESEATGLTEGAAQFAVCANDLHTSVVPILQNPPPAIEPALLLTAADMAQSCSCRNGNCFQLELEATGSIRKQCHSSSIFIIEPPSRRSSSSSPDLAKSNPPGSAPPSSAPDDSGRMSLPATTSSTVRSAGTTMGVLQASDTVPKPMDSLASEDSSVAPTSDTSPSQITGAPSMPHSPSTTHSVASPLRWNLPGNRQMVPPHFDILLDTLEMFWKTGCIPPSPALIASVLGHVNKCMKETGKGFYAQAGVNKFTKYLAKAEIAGVIALDAGTVRLLATRGS
jgi:hypothetical protein